MGRILLGILLGIVLVPVAVLGWVKYGNMPAEKTGMTQKKEKCRI